MRFRARGWAACAVLLLACTELREGESTATLEGGIAMQGDPSSDPGILAQAGSDGTGPAGTMPGQAGQQSAVDGCVQAVFYRDQDEDGRGDPSSSVTACETPSGHVREAGDCDDGCADCFVGGTEECDGRDNDCDGRTDESLARACGSPVGTCTPGMEACVDGAWGACSGVVAEETDACEGMLDEDCDGAVDEGCACSTGEMRSCGSTQGNCRAGTQSCEAAVWGGCVGAVLPGTEECDGEDDDCDGSTDEALTRPCGSDVGECVQGVQTCSEGEWGACDGEVAPAAQEVCDAANADEDCDGTRNEGCSCVDGTTRPCGLDEGVCEPGTETCVNGAWNGMCVGGTGPRAETCNGVDDDCNGAVDEMTDTDRNNCGTCGNTCDASAPTCVQGECTCQLSVCGGACVDTNTNAAHCGRCGHGCLGGTCSGGRCQPVTLHSADGSFGPMAVDGTHVYWVDTRNKTVSKVPINGGQAVVLATGVGRPWSIALDTSHVYWVEDSESGSLRKVAKGGGTPTTLAAAPYARDVFVHGGQVFYSGISWVRSIPASGGTPVTLSGEGIDYTGIAADATQVFWGKISSADERNVVQRVPRSGGTIVNLFTDSSATFSTRDIAIDANYVYFSNYTTDDSGALYRVGRNGGTAVPLAAGYSFIWEIEVDADGVYWSSRRNIYQTSHDGSVTVPVASVEAWGLATDEDAVYFTTTSGIVGKVAKP